MLWAHMQEQPIGRWHTVREDAKGLYVEGTMNLRTEKGRDAFEHVRGGRRWRAFHRLCHA